MDQDHSMLSTPSSVQDDTLLDEENFTSGPSKSTSTYVAAQTPENDHLNAAAPGELSPPRSQSIPSVQQSNGFAANMTMSGTNGAAGPDTWSDEDEAIDMKGEATRGESGREGKSKPGAGCKNKKAQEEMARAWENVVDKDFDIKQFGDVLAGKQR